MKVIYTEEEFKSLMSTVDKAIDTFHSLVATQLKYDHERELRRSKSQKGVRKHTFIVDDGDDDSDDDSDAFDYEVSTEDPPIPFTIHSNAQDKVDILREENIADSVEHGDLTEKEARDLHQAVEEGKVIFESLVALWLVNFMEEESEQPPRAETLKNLSLTKDGQRLLHYIIDSGGLTWAVKQCWPTGKDADLYLMRYVAENMTQVASILFPEVAQYLEHPNPLSE